MLTVIGSLLLMAALPAKPNPAPSWDDPFQGARFKSLPLGAVPLKPTDCDRTEYNKCTFVASVDFDGDGRRDRAYMANVGSTGIIVVSFANQSRRPMVVASFRDRLGGDSYISKDPADRKTIVFVQPEASAAEIRLIAGQPRMRWIGD